MNNLTTKSLSDIVKEHYQTAKIFENYGLDFCCKGKRSLVSACEEKGIEVQSIMKELDQALQSGDQQNNYDKMSLTELIEYIVRVHHQYIKVNAPQVLGYVQRIATKHGDKYPYMQEVYELFSEIKEELEEHMMKEEKALFPRIKLLELTDTGKIREAHLKTPIEVMEHEHDHAGTIMMKIRNLTNNYEAPETACTTHRLALQALKAFEEDLHTHVHLENNILFPKAIEEFSPPSMHSF
jgi:regulator of cell morphogenesis and NO signaling